MLLLFFDRLKITTKKLSAIIKKNISGAWLVIFGINFPVVYIKNTIFKKNEHIRRK